MNVINLTPWDLGIASLLVVALAICNFIFHFHQSKELIIAAIRTTIQLIIIGFILRVVFQHAHLIWVVLIAIVMLLAASREITVRQKRRFKGWWGFNTATISMFTSTFLVTIFVLFVIINAKPWYLPQYSIPLLGIMLGNTMTGISLCLNHLTDATYQARHIIEQRLLLGETRQQVLHDIKRDSMHTGMIPMINGMVAAGIISLPGTMTGQILAGSPPLEAAKYQILIMFLLAASTGFGILFTLWLSSKRLFDERDRLRLDRLR